MDSGNKVRVISWRPPFLSLPPSRATAEPISPSPSEASDIDSEPGGGYCPAMKTVLVTGATQGIGLHTALRLAQAGNHHVVLHGRTAESGEAALARIRSESGARNVSLVTGDLSDLAQVRGVADQVKEKVDGVDVLINNAGVFADEQRQTSADGYELTFAVNVLAPFALTKLLLPAMNRNGHVINTSSLSAGGSVPWDDLQLERAYSNHKAYSLSKLLIQMVTYALHRRMLDGAEYGGRGLKVSPPPLRSTLLLTTLLLPLLQDEHT